MTRSIFHKAGRTKPPPTPSLSRQSSRRCVTVTEDISDAEEEDEVVPLDEPELEEPSGSHEGVNELDSLLLATPLKRLQEREKAASLASKAKDSDGLWLSVKLRQEALALAKLHTQSIKVAASLAQEEDPDEEPEAATVPSLLAKAHFNLAKAYMINGCYAQTNDHCKQALALTPPLEEGEEGAAAAQRFISDVNATVGESLMEVSPPKSQTALSFFYAAAGHEDLSEVSDPGLKICIAQCLVLMGDAKLKEATAVRNAKVLVEQRLSMLSAKLSEMSSKKGEYEVQMSRIADANKELNAEALYEATLLSEAREYLDKASEAVMDVIADEESRLRSRYTDLAAEIISADKDKEDRMRQDYIDGYKQHPLVAMLWKLACDIMFKSSCVESVAGETKAQLKGLQEIKSAQASYSCLHPDVFASCLKEEGAARVRLACSMEDDEEAKETELERASDVYQALLDFQCERYKDDEAMQSTTRAEALKLIGNVCIARRQWGRARKSFEEALELFKQYLGPHHNLVHDLNFRISDIDQYE